MSIPFSGCFNTRAGVFGAISKQIKLLNLKAVNRITVKFDPFHPQAKDTRDFLFYISSTKLAEASPNYVVKTEVLCNREDPAVTVKLVPDIAVSSGTKLITFNSKNLTCLEILQLFNKYVTPLAPPEEEVQIVQTKSSKKQSKRR